MLGRVTGELQSRGDNPSGSGKGYGSSLTLCPTSGRRTQCLLGSKYGEKFPLDDFVLLPVFSVNRVVVGRQGRCRAVSDFSGCSPMNEERSQNRRPLSIKVHLK